MPSTIEAFYFVADAEQRGVIGHPSGEQQARWAHRLFLTRFGLSASAVPLLKLKLEEGAAPFSLHGGLPVAPLSSVIPPTHGQHVPWKDPVHGRDGCCRTSSDGLQSPPKESYSEQWAGGLDECKQRCLTTASACTAVEFNLNSGNCEVHRSPAVAFSERGTPCVCLLFTTAPLPPSPPPLAPRPLAPLQASTMATILRSPTKIQKQFFLII